MKELSFEPIFVSGYMRSGTTLLAALLGRHSRLAATPETHFFYDLTRNQRKNTPFPTHEIGLDLVCRNTRMADMKLDLPSLRDRFHACEPTPANVLRCALEQFASESGKSRVVEKSPDHLLYTPTILDWYPQAKMIAIVRDGRDAVLSILRSPWGGTNIVYHSHRWCRFQRLGEAYEAAYPGRLLRVQYERLLMEPRQELARLMEWLGLAFEERQLTNGEPGPLVPDWEEEWKGKVGKELDPERCFAWKRSASKEQVWLLNSIMGTQLRKEGYSDTGLEGCPLPRRIALRLFAFATGVVYSPLLYPVTMGLRKTLRRLGINVSLARVGRDVDGKK